ncbi:DUF4342 domain-containing protein [Serpentinicella alkaliphila]|uniref:Uncharacterized protein DUF4342 n=1 Tax=Serpentinicella alkaliphila TaxID=1734049 RepID=A0A4R2TYF3_9FIRM|nr:DUF4342 domain-containing protein [Serpentinicella alkaliphila]QUH26894.1 DUF4342 domain-containing protein [Serpentinicella alkaliphila]TCQ08127.1 uncharacterized protein DUF4342 [Serpentinicella alkaliphila]
MVDISLEKIDIVRDRTGVSYKKAKEALEANNGSVVDALISLEEEEVDKGWTKNASETGSEMLEKLKKVIEKGNVTKVILKKDDETILNIPVTAGAIGVILAPVAAILGVSAALVSRMKVEIVKKDGEVVDINEMAESKINNLRNNITINIDDEEDRDF